MPKVKTSRTKEPPEGYDEIEEVVRDGSVAIPTNERIF